MNRVSKTGKEIVNSSQSGDAHLRQELFDVTKPGRLRAGAHDVGRARRHSEAGRILTRELPLPRVGERRDDAVARADRAADRHARAFAAQHAVLPAQKCAARAHRHGHAADALRQQLAQCIAEQQYEECAALRDRIRALEKEETQHDGE